MSVVIPSRRLAAATTDDDGSQDGNGSCTFAPDVDYADAGGGGALDAASAADCCALCYTAATGLPQPCVAAVFAAANASAGGGDVGRCYLKLSSNQPIDRGTGSGLVACATDRPSPGASRAPPSSFACAMIRAPWFGKGGGDVVATADF